MDLEKTKDTIRQLLKLAADDAATQGEIENAMRFANKLMEKHQLSEEDLGQLDHKFDELDPKNATVGESGAFMCGNRKIDWEGFLARFVCDWVGGLGCYTTGSKFPFRKNGIAQLDKNGDVQYRHRVVFYGVAEDAELAREIYEECSFVISTMAILRFGGVAKTHGREYCNGFVSALWEKVNHERNKQRQLAHQSGTGNALLVIDARKEIVRRKTELAAAYKKQNLRLRSAGRSYGRYISDARELGRSDGAAYNPSQPTRRKKIGGS